MRISLFLFIILSLPCVQLHAQERGCTDPRAKNYGPAAVFNDGSCIYEKTTYKAETIIRKLPAILNENSGMMLWNDLFWFHNDSHNEPVLYALDTLDNIIKDSIRIYLAKNRDWEDISQDEDYIYIGDFGNNSGKRQDLKIYKIRKTPFYKNNDSYFQPDLIEFKYPDQHIFEFSRDHNFDCEALFPFRDSLYLFTKNWGDHKTKLYSIPKAAGNYTATLLDSFDAGGLITSAAINADSNLVVLLGYDHYQPFFILLSDFPETQFFKGHKRRIEMPRIYGYQTEAISFISGNQFVFSSEKTKLTPNRLFRVQTGEWTQTLTEVLNELQNPVLPFQLFKTADEFALYIRLPEPKAHIVISIWNTDIKHREKVRTNKHTSLYKTHIPSPEKGKYQIRIKRGKTITESEFSYD